MEHNVSAVALRLHQLLSSVILLFRTSPNPAGKFENLDAYLLHSSKWPTATGTECVSNRQH